VVTTIYFAVSDSYKSTIKKLETVAQVFEAFDKMFKSTEKINKLKYKKTYQRYKFDETKKVNTQFIQNEKMFKRLLQLQS
jgi:hypothetical protein